MRIKFKDNDIRLCKKVRYNKKKGFSITTANNKVFIVKYKKKKEAAKQYKTLLQNGYMDISHTKYHSC